MIAYFRCSKEQENSWFFGGPSQPYFAFFFNQFCSHISLKGDLNIYDINNSKVLKFYCLRMPLSNVAKNISATFIANQTIDYRSVSALYSL